MILELLLLLIRICSSSLLSILNLFTNYSLLLSLRILQLNPSLIKIVTTLFIVSTVRISLAILSTSGASWYDLLLLLRLLLLLLCILCIRHLIVNSSSLLSKYLRNMLAVESRICRWWSLLRITRILLRSIENPKLSNLWTDF